MGIDFPLFFPFMEYQRMTRDSTQYKTNLDFMRFYGILFHRIPCGKMTTCNRRLPKWNTQLVAPHPRFC